MTFLQPEEVAITVDYSSVNYKDALALTGHGDILRIFPIIPGIDLVGTVESSKSARFGAGGRVILNGDDIGEKSNGGFAECTRVRSNALIGVATEVARNPTVSVVGGRARCIRR